MTLKSINIKLLILVTVVLVSGITSAQQYETTVAKTTYGITLFAFDKETGAIMYNHATGGKNPGQWKPFGESIQRDNKSLLQFQVVSHPNKGVVFWAFEPNGKVYVTNNFRGNKNFGKWLPYGNTLDESDEGRYQFSAIFRGQGKTSLIAVNQNTGKLFFMHTFTEKSKKWLPFGGLISE